MNKLEVDPKAVLELFADLTSKEQRQSYRNALRNAAKILSKETKKELRISIGLVINHRNKWNNKTLGSGIKVKVLRKGTESKVHIMGDFRLKFFEMGTNKRFLKTQRSKNGERWNTGRMKAIHFFRKAKQNKEREIFDKLDSLLILSIQKIANKHK